MRVKKSGVYGIFNRVTGRVYIGSSVDIDTRWRDHKRGLRNGSHINPYLQKSWNKYGESCFELVILEKTPPDMVIACEQRYLDDQALSKYNIATVAGRPVGRKGVKVSEETKEKLRLIFKGRPKPPRTPEHKENLRRAHLGKRHPEGHGSMRKGRKLSEETKEKLRATWNRNRTEHVAALRRSWQSPTRSHKIHTAEHKAELSKSMTGRKTGPLSDETKAKLSAAKKGHKLSEETKQRMREAHARRHAKKLAQCGSAEFELERAKQVGDRISTEHATVQSSLF